jgi:hypothetical protein
VILHRCFAWDAGAAPTAPGGALWFPRTLQGEGRHDAPDRYGCLYVSEQPVSAVVEELARFSGTRLREPDLRRGGLPLALAALSLPDTALLLDLDSPALLKAEELRPSAVATRDRAQTQATAVALRDRHRVAVGLRWWSSFEARWTNVTLYDRARDRLGVEELRPLRLDDEVAQEAARHLGLRAAA